jgi:hypothetical protein
MSGEVWSVIRIVCAHIGVSTFAFAKEMKTTDYNLPPKWLKVCSWLFMIFLIIPVISAFQVYSSGTQLGVSAFGLDLEGDKDPLGWMLAVDGVLFLVALTGLFIVTKRSFAYSFGVFYCAVTLGVTLPAHFFVGDWDGAAWTNIVTQYSLLVAFLIHLIRNRARWINQNANKTVVDNRLPAPSRNDPHDYNL